MSPAQAPSRKPPSRKKPSTKRKPAAKKAAARRAPARKTTARRAPARKAPARKPKARKAPARKPPARRPAARRRFGWRARIVAGLAVLAAAGAGYMFWLRDSSLVAVTDVEVVGVTTGDRAEIVTELTAAAKEMTTLHSDAGRLESIATRFPTVAGIDVDPNFPHGMRIEVRERPPRLLAEAGGEQTPVAADGTVLAGVDPPKDQNLPVLALREPPVGRLEGTPLDEAVVAGSAPDPLLGLVEKVDNTDEFGIVLTLRGGIELRFGTPERVAQKWAAAAAVLADPKLDVATYVDLRVPERPAVGGAG